LELFREHGSVERNNDRGRPNKRMTEAAGNARQIIEIALHPLEGLANN
jgi:hypothetical protein